MPLLPPLPPHDGRCAVTGHPLGSPELRHHVAHMVWLSQLPPWQRLQVDGDIERFYAATRKDQP